MGFIVWGRNETYSFKLYSEFKTISFVSEYNLSGLNCEKFKKIVSKAFSGKIQQFNTRYGKIEANILPYDFYDWIRRSGINRKK